MPASAGTARVFFALWPDDATRGALARLATGLRRECGGRAVPARNLHLTLAFIGNIESDRVSVLRALATDVVAPSFAMMLDTVNYWRHNRIVWAGPRECPEALRILVAALGHSLKNNSVSFDHRPYAPHVTLLRNARRAPAAVTLDKIEWCAQDFALVQSVHRDGVSEYEVLERWTLTA
jgi:2'-5' RNA ligase